MVKNGQWNDYENGKKKELWRIRQESEGVCIRKGTTTRDTNPDNIVQPVKNDTSALVISPLEIWLGKPYRDIVSFLADCTYLWPIIGLKVIPGRMWTCRGR